MRFRACLGRIVLAVLLFVAGTLPAYAAVVFYEDFDDITLTTDPLPLTDSTTGSSFTSNVTTNANSRVAARTLGSNPFGADSDNDQFLELIDGRDVTAGLRGPTTSTISGTGFHVSFDFFDPSSTETGINDEVVSAGGQFYLSDNDSATNTHRLVEVEFANGDLNAINTGEDNGGPGTFVAGTYTQDEKHSVDLVGNLSASTINYDLNGSQSVDPARFDIFIDGSLLASGDDVQFRRTLLTEVTTISFAGLGSGSRSVTYFDNVVLHDSAPGSLPGDYNGDGIVDAADYTVWRDNLGGNSLTNETVSLGIVDQADYDEWKSHFGTGGAGSLSVSMPAPEPGASVLFGFGVAGWAIALLRRCR